MRRLFVLFTSFSSLWKDFYLKMIQKWTQRLGFAKFKKDRVRALMGDSFIPIQDMMKQFSILLFVFLFSTTLWAQSSDEKKQENPCDVESNDPNLNRIGCEDGTSVNEMQVLYNGFQPYAVVGDAVTLGGPTETPFRPEGSNGISNSQSGNTSPSGDGSSQ